MNWSDLKFWKSKDWETLSKIEGLPAPDLRFTAFDLTPFPQVKVVILGQDPYPTKGHAHGLAFSVQPHVTPIPPSLRNIHAEYQADTGFPKPRNGDLTSWARGGVLLLNTIFTVEEGKPLSHENKGWEKLTYEVLSELSAKGTSIVFLLWGKRAQQFQGLLDSTRHHCICSPHPSPLSKGFLGSKPFSKTNAYRKEKKLEEINWRLP